VRMLAIACNSSRRGIHTYSESAMVAVVEKLES
jgi:hypothetical protein